MVREVLAEANQAEIGKVGITIGVTRREKPQPGQCSTEVKTKLDHARIKEGQDMAGGLDVVGCLG